MKAEYIQNLRYKLQKRVRRLNLIDHPIMFHFALKQFWGFLCEYPVFKGILHDLELRFPSAQIEAEKIISERKGIVFTSELENITAAYFVIKKCLESDKNDIESHAGFAYIRKFEGAIESFRLHFLEPFYEYLDEQLDDQRAILAILRRYKHKCEWFQRYRLFKLWEEDTQRGEKRLALHLYEYLHDQGIDFNIEPWSISGEADLVASQSGEEPLIADVKIFNSENSRGKTYIAKGFNQIYQYTLDYNESFGYLIIFKTSEEDLRFALSNQEQSTPFVVHNNKTIFLITIDIFPHAESASKRGMLKTMEITEEDLVHVIEE